MRSLRETIPKPLRALPWRLGWLRGSVAYRQKPLLSLAKLGYWTIGELLGRDVTVTLQGGQRLRTTTRNFTSLSVYLTGERDPEFQAFIGTVLKSGGVFVDIGANVGVYTLFASPIVGDRGKVLSIEANPSTFAYLEANRDLNGLRNVSCINCAVGREAGEVTLATSSDNFGETHVASRDGERGGGVTVKVRTLDEIVRELAPGSVTYIKIDVEGFELAVLQGAREVLTRNRDVMVQLEMIASHAIRYGSGLAEIVAFMVSLDFLPFEIGDGGTVLPIDCADIGRQADILWRRDAGRALPA